MRGLLIKDLKILSQQKRTWMLMVLISVIMLFSTSDFSFIIGYVTILASIVALSTISYDEMDNGYTFLFTLPVDAKGYVLTKYILSIGISTLVWGAANVLFFIAGKGAYGMEDFVGAVLLLVVALMMQFIMIPLQLKFGAEKSRIVYLIVVGAVVLLGLLFGQFSGFLPDLSGLAAWIERLQVGVMVGLFVLCAVIVALISFTCSCRVMNKKQL